METGKELKKILKERDMSQKQLSDLTGIPCSALSQYISGKSTPSDERLRLIERTLDLPECHLDAERAGSGMVKRISVEEAAHIMGLGVETLKAAMRAKECLPWGRAIETGKNAWVYWVNEITFKREMGL